MSILYNNINTFNKNLKVLNSLSKEEQNITLEYIKPLSFDLAKNYVYINSVYQKLYCYFNEHYINSFKLVTDLIKNNNKTKLDILLNYKKYLQSNYPEYYPGSPSKIITYGEWVEVPDEGADTEAACYPTHNIYVPKKKIIDDPASIPVNELEDLEKILNTLEKKEFQSIDLNSLKPICNYLNENIINISKAMTINCNETEKIELINKIKNLVQDFNNKVYNIFKQDLNLDFNIDKLAIGNSNTDLETTWVALMSSLKMFSSNLSKIADKYIKDNIKLSDKSLFECQYVDFFKKKLNTEINFINETFKDYLLFLLNKEQENIKILKYTL